MLLVMLPLYAGAETAASYNTSPPPARLWLEKMSAAFRQISYRGVFVYQQGGRLETLAVTQQVVNGRVRERLLYLDGQPREMVRDGDKLTYSALGQGVVRFNHGALMPVVARFADPALGNFYQVVYRKNPLDRVAGREAVVLSVIPVDSDRYGYQLWVDKLSGLLLKSIMVDSRGNVMERLQSTGIEPGADLSVAEQAAMDKSNQPRSQAIDMTQAPAQGGVWNWEAGWIPAGFIAKSYTQSPSPVSDYKTDAVIYSDGLASFSVFIEPDETRVLSQASENIGAQAAVSKVFRNGNTYFNVTVVGDIPLGTAERVAVSIRPRRAETGVDKTGAAEE